jgi:hypothetical protein
LTFISTPSGLGSNDSTDWSQLGGDQTDLAGGFSAISVLSIVVSGNFSAGDNTGLVADVCPSSPACSWSASGSGMNAGDADIWAFDNGNAIGTGPITLSFSTPLVGAGAWIEGDTGGSFTAQIQAFDGGSSLGSFALTSDGSGDPIFLGLLENPATANITSIVFSLTVCAGCNGGGDTSDFAIDSLLMADQGGATPEPASLLLLGGGLTAMAWTLRKRSSVNRQSS